MLAVCTLLRKDSSGQLISALFHQNAALVGSAATLGSALNAERRLNAICSKVFAANVR